MFQFDCPDPEIKNQINVVINYLSTYLSFNLLISLSYVLIASAILAIISAEVLAINIWK